MAALRQIMRLRGFSAMTNILEDYKDDVEINMLVSSSSSTLSRTLTSFQAMECMQTWPLIQRNKVEDSQVDRSVQQLSMFDNETVATLAKAVSCSL